MLERVLISFRQLRTWLNAQGSSILSSMAAKPTEYWHLFWTLSTISPAIMHSTWYLCFMLSLLSLIWWKPEWTNLRYGASLNCWGSSTFDKMLSKWLNFDIFDWMFDLNWFTQCYFVRPFWIIELREVIEDIFWFCIGKFYNEHLRTSFSLIWMSERIFSPIFFIFSSSKLFSRITKYFSPSLNSPISIIITIFSSFLSPVFNSSMIYLKIAKF